MVRLASRELTRTPVIVVDIDNTIVDEDTGRLLEKNIRKILDAQKRLKIPIVIVTGRPPSAKEDTDRLLRHTQLRPAAIFFRPDLREPIVKYKIRVIKESQFYPRAVFDDNTDVLDAFEKTFGGEVYET